MLVNTADFGDDLEIEGDVLVGNDLMRTTTHLVVRVTGLLEHRHRLRVKMLWPRSADAEELATKTTCVHSAESQFKKPQQVATRGCGVSKAEWDKLCKAKPSYCCNLAV